jgi:hypothetical protein
MRMISVGTYSALLLASVISLSACGSGGVATAAPPAAHEFDWAVNVDSVNATANCAYVSYFVKQSDGWGLPISPDGGHHVKPGQTGPSHFTFFNTQANVQFRIQAGIYKTKQCSGAQTVVQADTQTIAQSAVITATLTGKAGNYSIAMATSTSDIAR